MCVMYMVTTVTLHAYTNDNLLRWGLHKIAYLYSLPHHAIQSHLARKHGTSNSQGGESRESRPIRESLNHRSVKSFSTHLWQRCWVQGLTNILTITRTLTSMCPESSQIQQVVLLELFNTNMRWVCRARKRYLPNIHLMLTTCTELPKLSFHHETTVLALTSIFFLSLYNCVVLPYSGTCYTVDMIVLRLL